MSIAYVLTRGEANMVAALRELASQIESGHLVRDRGNLKVSSEIVMTKMGVTTLEGFSPETKYHNEITISGEAVFVSAEFSKDGAA